MGDVRFLAETVERRPTAALVPYARNARTHSAEQVGQIAASMREFGWTYPVLVDEEDGILVGHGRVLAALKLKLPEVPVMVARGWSDAQKRAYILADNRIALSAGWDDALLRIELGDLATAGFDLSLTGFGSLELTSLFATQEGNTDPDEVPEAPVQPVSQLGDLWRLGDHRIMCADGLDIACVRALLAGVTPDLANCDPPYGISVVKGASDGGAKPFGAKGKVGGGNAPFGGWKDGDRTKGAKRGREHGPAKKAMIKPGLYAPVIGDDSTATAVASYHVLVELGVQTIVLWGGNYYADKLPASRCWLIWDKENSGTFADAELAWTNQDKVVRLLRHQWNGLMKASERGQRRVHPTQKPVALAEWVADTIAPKARTVLDLFLGSGSVLIAAQNRGLTCYGMELSPAYIDVAAIRWENFTGEKAVLGDTGETFADVKERRNAEATL